MEKKDLISKEQLEKTLQSKLNSYLNVFLSRNGQSKCSEELITGLGIGLHTELLKALDPWVPKENKEE